MKIELKSSFLSATFLQTLFFKEVFSQLTLTDSCHLLNDINVYRSTTGRAPIKQLSPSLNLASGIIASTVASGGVGLGLDNPTLISILGEGGERVEVGSVYAFVTVLGPVDNFDLLNKMSVNSNARAVENPIFLSTSRRAGFGSALDTNGIAYWSMIYSNVVAGEFVSCQPFLGVQPSFKGNQTNVFDIIASQLTISQPTTTRVVSSNFTFIPITLSTSVSESTTTTRRRNSITSNKTSVLQTQIVTLPPLVKSSSQKSVSWIIIDLLRLFFN